MPNNRGVGRTINGYTIFSSCNVSLKKILLGSLTNLMFEWSFFMFTGSCNRKFFINAKDTFSIKTRITKTTKNRSCTTDCQNIVCVIMTMYNAINQPGLPCMYGQHTSQIQYWYIAVPWLNRRSVKKNWPANLLWNLANWLIDPHSSITLCRTTLSLFNT